MFRFSLLEKEVKAVFGAQDKEGKSMIEKLKLFIQIDFDTIQHVIVSALQITPLNHSSRGLLVFLSGEDVLAHHVLTCQPVVPSACNVGH